VGDDREVLDEKRGLVLFRTMDGFTIRSEEPPFEMTFAPTDEGSDEAWEAFRRSVRLIARGRALARAKKIAIAATVAFALFRTVDLLTYAWWGTFDRQPGSDTWFTWVSLLDIVAYSLFIASVGLCAVLWLDGWSRENGYRASVPGRGRSWIGPGRSLRNPPSR
jgi:hypothetical protein